MTVFDNFRAALPPIDRLHEGLIGRDAVIDGPFGPRKLVYADYVASGRAHEAVEAAILRDVLPWYANSHTEASHCGATMTRLRRLARAEILRCTNGRQDHAVIFAGSGATAGLNRLVHLLGAGPGTTVLIGPYEHHSNILPWRECGATVVEIAEAPCGGPDTNGLARTLAEAKGQVIASFSAASNVTGIVSDVAELTRIVKAAGAKIIWDYAGAALYLPIDLGLGMDAVVVSPHKFVGGPGASGLLLLRRDAVVADRPTLPGGGTVRFVNAQTHVYAAQVEAREEAGTPNVVGDIRAALVMVMKHQMGQGKIDARNKAHWQKARARFAGHPSVELLGNLDCDRLPILAFRVRDGRGGYIHQQLATRMLSDHFGVQARGGCACAGPYVHRLLNIDDAGSELLRQSILAGNEMDKPGFVRLNLCWAAPEAEVDAILDAVSNLASVARQADYTGDAGTAIFHPCAAQLSRAGNRRSSLPVRPCLPGQMTTARRR